MDTYEAILTKLDVREFANKKVDDGIKTKILQAARFTGSSMNSIGASFSCRTGRDWLPSPRTAQPGRG